MIILATHTTIANDLNSSIPVPTLPRVAIVCRQEQPERVCQRTISSCIGCGGGKSMRDSPLARDRRRRRQRVRPRPRPF